MADWISFAVIAATLAAIIFLWNRHGAKKILSMLQNLNIIRSEVEVTVVDFVAGFIPWLSSIIPAYFSYVHLNTILHVPAAFAFLFALVVEGLGFANVSTAIQFAEYNKQKQFNKNFAKQKAPTRIVIGNLGIYLTVIVLVNGILGFFGDVNVENMIVYLRTNNMDSLITELALPLAKVFVILLLSLLTIPGAITVALRVEHQYKTGRKRVVSISGGATTIQKPTQVIVQEQQHIEAYNSKETSKDIPFTLTPKRRKFLEHLRKNRSALQNKTKLANELGVTRQSIDKWIELFEQNNMLAVNDNMIAVRVRLEEDES